jgi:hypothetical protein
MSTLVLWAGVDTRGISSAYIATDSRLSDSKKLEKVWDAGQKAYSSTSAPLLAGYVGSSFYAAHIVPRLVTYGEAILPEVGDDESFLRALATYARSALSSAPPSDDTNFEITVAYRLTQGFFGFGVVSSAKADVAYRIVGRPSKSAILHLSGTGASFVRHKFEEWRKTNAADTSRAIYSAFCDALLHVNPPNQDLIPGKSKDPQSEGPPQLVGLYRKPNSPGKYFGTVWRGKVYYAGVETQRLPINCECRNDLFERCDPRTKAPFPLAKRHIDEVAQAKRLTKKQKH